MRFTFLILICALGACNTPGPAFYGATAVTRDMDGSRFLIRIKGDLAEVTRTSSEWLPRFEAVSDRASRALVAETGCQVDWIVGDPAMMQAGLACDGRPAPTKPRAPEMLYCDAVRNGPFGGGGSEILGFDCEIY